MYVLNSLKGGMQSQAYGYIYLIKMRLIWKPCEILHRNRKYPQGTPLRPVTLVIIFNNSKAQKGHKLQISCFRATQCAPKKDMTVNQLMTQFKSTAEFYILYSKQKWSEVKSLSRVRLFATPWTVAYQASPSMGFSRQEYWSGLPFPSPGDLPDPGMSDP